MMKHSKTTKLVFTTITLLFTFFLGFGFRGLTAENLENTTDFKRVTGIGGVFFKCAKSTTSQGVVPEAPWLKHK